MRGAGDTRDNFLFDAHNGALPTTANDMVENVIPSAFDPYMLTNADIDTLRAFAKARARTCRARRPSTRATSCRQASSSSTR